MLFLIYRMAQSRSWYTTSTRILFLSLVARGGYVFDVRQMFLLLPSLILIIFIFISRPQQSQNQIYHASTSSDHRLMLSLMSCKIMVQFLKLYQLVSLTLATPSSNALLAKSKAFSTSPHRSQRNTDMLRCKLSLTQCVGGRLPRARLSAFSQHSEAVAKYLPSPSSTSQRYRQKSALSFRQKIWSSGDPVYILPDSTIFIIFWQMLTSQASIVALQLFKELLISLDCLAPIFLLTALSTLIQALLLFTRFLYAAEQRFLSAAVSCSPRSNSLLANYAISSYLQVC